MFNVIHHPILLKYFNSKTISYPLGFGKENSVKSVKEWDGIAFTAKIC